MILEFEGKKPQIYHSVRIFDNVSIIGDVSIDEDLSVWFGSVIRGDLNAIKIGKRTNIQDLVIIHTLQQGDGTFPNGLPTIVGDDCTIGHSSCYCMRVKSAITALSVWVRWCLITLLWAMIALSRQEVCY